ncbi:hypothetical protein [Vreelandella lutescens]|nr:hypothetical protein [Halomonas lutescens]
MAQQTVASQSAGTCHLLSREPPLSLLPAPQGDAVSEKGVHFFVDASYQSDIDPVQREDIERQLAVADALYQEVLRLTPPLQMPRYQQADFIMVILRTDQTRGGQAYDEVVRNPSVPECHIRMALGGQVDAAHNLTPAHELFHLYQNAHMMFKQAWVHEGLARWSESLLRGDGHSGPALPADRDALEAVMQSSYSAVAFWQRLFYLTDTQGDVAVPEALVSQRYHNGQPIVALGRLYGADFMSHLFAELHQAGVAVSYREQWPIYGWAESEQRSPRHNPAILSALYKAVSTYLPVASQPDELRAFMQLIAPLME